MTARMAIVVLASMMTAFSTTRQIRTVLLLFALVTAIGIGFAIPDVYRGVERARAFVRGPIAWHDYVSNAMHDGLGQVVFVWTAMCLTLANCLALRFAGCHLIRPAENARRALS